MSDSRRRRQIKTPSGPRKKDAPDLTKYQMSPPPMGRQEVPKPKPKPDPSQQRSGGQRGGGGQRQGGAQAAETKVVGPWAPAAETKVAEVRGRRTSRARSPRR